MGLAWKIAWSWARKTGLPYEDLESIALMGLIRGCRKYDPERINPGTGRPYALSSVACPYIHGELLHHFRDNPYAIRYPNQWRENYGKVMRMLGEGSDHAAIAQATGLPIEEVSELVETMTRPAELQDELIGGHAHAPELDLAGPLLELVAIAFEDLVTADRAALYRYIESPSRAFPAGPHQQMEKRLERLLNGRRLPQLRQLSLLAVPEVAAARKRAARRRAARVRVLSEQMALAV